ncbi:MAG: SAM-dependent methyltransferase [Oscillospiraceae bacterium]|nr:SAM-dependent methyltransferase [Oscillospiraceae bacterium]
MANLREELAAALPGLQKAVFSQPADKLSDQKVTVRPVRMKGKLAYQVERFRDNKAFHQNLDDTALLSLVDNELEGRYRQVLIVGERESAQYVLRQKGGYKKTGRSASMPRPGGDQTHNRAKEYILREGENIPALVDLGVFTPDFRIVRSKYDKYKQINRFVELVDQELGRYEGREIRILDFGCGKSYLSFILYYYFVVKRGIRAQIIGYDLKADVVEHCNQIAEKYGYAGLRFQVADVTRDALSEEAIDMVVTLHACDTATDYALDYAIRRKVKHIFSVPCCQHEVNGSIHKGGQLDLLLNHGIIRERLCALLTDSIRAAVLEARGYELDMIEFIDFAHSPKNIMLRAGYTGRCRTGGLEQALALQEQYGFKQTLLDLQMN